MIRPTGRARVSTLAALLLAGGLALTGCAGGAETGGDLDGKQLLTIPREDLADVHPELQPVLTERRADDAAGDLRADAGRSTRRTPPRRPGWRPSGTWRQGRHGRHVHPARRCEVVGRRAVHGRRRRLHLRAAEGARSAASSTSTRSRPPTSTRSTSPSTRHSPRPVRDRPAGHRPQARLVESIDDPANETNPTPVGTGPYTEVANFQSQSFELQQEPQLLAAGQAEDRGHPDARLRRQRPGQPRHHQR